MKRFMVLLLATWILQASVAYASNSDCLSCHDVSGSGATARIDMHVPPVDRATACLKCHWEPAGGHPYHNANWNCGSCHSEMRFTDPARVPLVSTAYGYFHQASSALADEHQLHIIHASPGWPAGVSKKGRRCASCHEAVACTACHETPDPTHADHAWDESAGAYAPGLGPADVVFGTGTSGGNEYELNLTSGLTCSNATCHDVSSGVYRPTLVQEADPSVRYTPTGAWSRTGREGYSANAFAWSNWTGARAELDFTGERVELMTDLHPYRGLARVWIDGVETATVDLYSPVVVKQYIAYTSPVMPSGPHTITVEVLGQKNPAARDCFVVLDALRVYGKYTTTVTQCATCHPDRLIPHGMDPLTHTAEVGTETIAGRYPDAAKPDGYIPGTVQDGFAPEGDGSRTATVVVFPASPSTFWDKVDDPTNDNDTTYIAFNGVGRLTFTYGAFAVPASSTISDVRVYFRHKRAGTGVAPSYIGASLKVGGSTYDTPTPGISSGVSYVLTNRTFTRNPRTGLPWTVDEINNKANPNGLQEFGVYSSDASPSVRVTEMWVVVDYVMDPTVYYGPITCETCHDMQIDTEHGKATASSAPAGCGTCHPTPRDSFGSWNKTCTQGGCHPAPSPSEMHHALATAMQVTNDPEGCTAECHHADIAGEHHKALDANGLYGDVFTYYSVTCEQCHQEKVANLSAPWTKDCVACHPTYHPNRTAKHTTPNLGGGYAGGIRTCPLPLAGGGSCSNVVCHHAGSPLADSGDVSVIHVGVEGSCSQHMCHSMGPDFKPGTGYLDDCGICHFGPATPYP